MFRFHTFNGIQYKNRKVYDARVHANSHTERMHIKEKQGNTIKSREKREKNNAQDKVWEDCVR